MSLDCRRACSKNDFADVVKLQNENMAAVLSEEEKQDGFLSGGFGEDEYARMNETGRVIVSYDGDSIVGFLAAGTVDFNMNYGLPSAMIKSFPSLAFEDRTLNEYQVIIAGPVCVAKSHRGKGIFLDLYRTFENNMPSEIELITTLVSTSNPRSLAAHHKAGLEMVGEFVFGERAFALLAKRV